MDSYITMHRIIYNVYINIIYTNTIIYTGTYVYIVLIYQYHDPIGICWQTTLIFLIKRIMHSFFHSFNILV